MLKFFYSAFFVTHTKTGINFFTKFSGLFTFICFVATLNFLLGFFIDATIVQFNYGPIAAFLLKTIEILIYFLSILFMFKPTLTYIFFKEPVYRLIDLMQPTRTDGEKSSLLTRFTANIFKYLFVIFAFRVGILPEIKKLSDIRRLTDAEKIILNKRMFDLFRVINDSPSMRETAMLNFFDLRFSKSDMKLIQNIRQV